MGFHETIDAAGKAVDVAGVVVIVAGMLWVAASSAFRKERSHARYRDVRHSLGRAILLGLEILVAADIIRTVAERPTFSQVGVLAVIVGIRTFLSLALELEISGRWPWQERPENA